MSPSPRTHTLSALLLSATMISSVTAASTVSATDPLTVPLAPAGTLEVDAQYRPRVLVTTGRKFDAERDFREYVTQRARLGLTLKRESGLAFTIGLQDVRIWGEEDNTLNDYSADGFDVHEAFAVLPAAKWLELKIGRQELVLDNSRLVGNVGWTQRARSFDAVRASFDFHPLKLDVFYAKVREAESYPDGHVPKGIEDDVDFGGVHTTVHPAKGHKISTLYLVNANHGYDTAGDEHLRHTAGLYAKGGIAGVNYQAEAYYQFGRISDKKIGAYMVAARAGYKFQAPGTPHATIWGEYLSGDGTPSGTFDSLYATNHKFYGEMDFFLTIPKHTANLGLVDLGGRLGGSITKELKVHADLHHLRAADKTATGASVFGNEFDFKVILALMDHVSLRALYGVFLPGEAMKTPQGIAPSKEIDTEHLGYLTLDMKL